MDTRKLMDKAIEFHGHSCPGLAIGVMASKYILEHDNDFSVDEELVAVVENDNCSVDAIQSLLGTTFGKGNFIFKDYGKNSYTFYNRIKKNAVRLTIKNDIFRDKNETRDQRTEMILNKDPEQIFTIQKIDFNPPEHAKIHDSVICNNCGEITMKTRTQKHEDIILCIPCYEEKVNRA